MRVACDIDGTITAAPVQFEALLTALRAAGHRVTILTGSTDSPVTQEDFDNKVKFLTGLGCVGCWDDMVVFSAEGDKLSRKKAKWCGANDIDLFIDNDEGNAMAATPLVPLVLVPWTTRVP